MTSAEKGIVLAKKHLAAAKRRKETGEIIPKFSPEEKAKKLKELEPLIRRLSVTVH